MDGDTANVLMLDGADVTDGPAKFVKDVGAELVNEFGAVAIARIIGGPVRRKLHRNTLATSGNSVQCQIR